jgi:hypothetical protein
LAVNFNHGLVNATPTVRKGWRWGIGMTTLLERLKYLNAGLRFIFANATRYP